MTFNEHDINRDSDGKFGEKTGARPEVGLESTRPPYVSTPEDRSAAMKLAIDVQGEDAWGEGDSPYHPVGGYSHVNINDNVVTFMRGFDVHREDGPAVVTFENGWPMGEYVKEGVTLPKLTEQDFDNIDAVERGIVSSLRLDPESAADQPALDGVSHAVVTTYQVGRLKSFNPHGE